MSSMIWGHNRCSAAFIYCWGFEPSAYLFRQKLQTWNVCLNPIENFKPNNYQAEFENLSSTLLKTLSLEVRPHPTVCVYPISKPNLKCVLLFLVLGLRPLERTECNFMYIGKRFWNFPLFSEVHGDLCLSYRRSRLSSTKESTENHSTNLNSSIF